MPKMIGSGLSRREREILDVLYKQGKSSASEVHANLPEPPGYSAVRTLLSVLVEKGHVRHEVEGKKFLYFPTQPRQEAARSALKRVVDTFFGGSLAGAARTFLSGEDTDLSDEELSQLSEIVAQAQAAESRKEKEPS
ncbi:MAG: BlaI/MecI/CopY family transcriptional regulator [Akkermansiaceae bacterium]|nr:BlaI/MecI/CopY family transcriptional regulator [Armatimonadota bacterium]